MAEERELWKFCQCGSKQVSQCPANLAPRRGIASAPVKRVDIDTIAPVSARIARPTLESLITLVSFGSDGEWRETAHIHRTALLLSYSASVRRLMIASQTLTESEESKNGRKRSAWIDFHRSWAKRHSQDNEYTAPWGDPNDPPTSFCRSRPGELSQRGYWYWRG
jgi:hypothetical protein